MPRLIDLPLQVSGEVVENKNQQICHHASHHTNHGASTEKLTMSQYFQVLRYLLVQAYCFPDSMYEAPSEAKNSLMHCHCSRCGEKGHYRSSKKRCREHEEYCGAESISDSDSELDSDEEDYN
jgi:hypothetical protein